LPAPELIGDLRKAFEDGLVDHGYADLEGLERDARVPFEKKERWKREKLSRLVSDTVSEMSWWAAFAADDRPKPPVFHQEPIGQASPSPGMECDDPEDYALEALPNTGLRRGPKIGRNDPCPCGSGKKYKKCCLGK
jgi:preprotein translocase subunit SecA